MVSVDLGNRNSIPSLACVCSDVQVRATPDMEPELHKTGKIPLREAFPESFSAWRRKDPIEVGSGSSELSSSAFWTDLISSEELEKEQELISREDGVVIRDSEHLWYYREFLRQFERVSCKWLPQLSACGDYGVVWDQQQLFLWHEQHPCSHNHSQFHVHLKT
jgi:hypothetical protein